MKLSKLSTSPRKLFEDIKFHPGLNIIFAHKSEDDVNPHLFDNSEGSLHAVGKSTLLDLIAFALLVDFDKSLPRLQNAYNEKILHGISVILEFSINGIDYYIKRSFDTPNKEIYFGQINAGKKYTLGNLQKELFRLIFHRQDYKGSINQHWYLKLLSYFIKIKKREELFSDPIDFSRNLTDLDLAPFHLFLLNIDNSLPYQYKELNEHFNKLNNSFNEIQKLALEKNNTKDLLEIENRKVGLNNSVLKLKNRVSTFSLKEEYAELEEKADIITTELKNLWFRNAVDQKKLKELETYDTNTPTEIYENLSTISAVYNEMLPFLGDNVKRTLEEVVDFRKSLYESRKEFVSKEKGRLNTNLFNRNNMIEDLEKQRKEVFEQLSSQKALDDLTRTYTKLATAQKELSEVETSLQDIDTKRLEINNVVDEINSLLYAVDNYLESISPAISDFRSLLKSIYEKLFLDSHKVNIFSFSQVEEKQKFKLSVLEGTIIDSTGINQVRTLIYDVAVLVNIISQSLNAPRFIIHDGIFENLHQSHFFAFIKYIDEMLAKNSDFQYILTLNDHDFLNEDPNFKEEIIIANSIIKLTPQKTLLGKEF